MPAAMAPAAPGSAAGLASNYVAKPLPEKILNTDAKGIRRLTHTEHHKLYSGYVKKYNEIVGALAKLDADPAAANQTYSPIRELKVELTFAIGGIKNHELYFDTLGGDGIPKGDAADALASAFGSIDKWRRDLKATGLAGRGWAWTAIDNDLGVFNFLGDAQNTYPVWNAVPFIGLDVYEHAYVMDFATDRGRYIDAFLQSLDWDAVNARFSAARAVPNAPKGTTPGATP
jgi:Fe-Mn family superoxide dismutase